MKKLSVLIFLFTVSLLGASRAPRVFAVNDCNWTIDNGLKFCYGGFTSEQDLRNSKVQFQCISNCGGLGGGSTMEVQTGNTPNFQPVRDANRYYNCLSSADGRIDQAAISAVRSAIDARSAVMCGGSVISLNPLIVQSTIILKLAGQQSLVDRCLTWVNSLGPTFEARVIDGSGAKVCSSQQKFDVKGDKTVTSGGGSIPAETIIQAGTGLQFCDGGKGIITALGCIPTEPSAFIGKLLTVGIGLAGGIAFLLILFGGFQIMTSAGNPEQLNAGRELVSSAIAGLLLIIFSVFILRSIGVDILGIPGFTK